MSARSPVDELLDVSVVIPCLNEAPSLGECVDAAKRTLDELGLSGEVVIADNGSTDGSQELGSSHGGRVVTVAPRGYGCAVRAGIERARGRYIVVGDADGQHDFSELGRFLAKLDDGYDVVIGNRFGGEIQPRAMSWSHRYIGNPLLSALLRLLFHRGIHDPQCGFRALTRSAYAEMDLRTTGFELCPEMVVKAAHHGLRITEIGITVRADQRDRAPHLRTLPDGWRHLIFLLMCSPNSLFILPGLTLLGAGIAIVSWLFTGPQRLGHISLDTRAELFGVIIASLGFQIASIGIFARVFSYSEPRQSRTRSLDRAFKTLKLEQGLAIGGVLIAIGLGGGIWAYVSWASHGFGIVRDDRVIIFWSLWFLLGIQTSFASIFLSMIGISRGTWIGDRT